MGTATATATDERLTVIPQHHEEGNLASVQESSQPFLS